MDDQSFQLLMLKLEGLEDGQSRIQVSLDKRLDEHNVIFRQHTDDDKKAWEKLNDVTMEVRIGKRVVYLLTSAITGVLGYVGWTK